MSSRSRMVNASAVSSAPSLDVASATLRVPCGPSSGRRQALTEQWSISPDAFFCESMTVHAPQPPCPQEILVPVRPMAFSRRSAGAAQR